MGMSPAPGDFPTRHPVVEREPPPPSSPPLPEAPKEIPKTPTWVWLGIAVYVISGVCQPLVVDLLRYQGLMGGQDPTRPSTHLGVLLNVLGMVAVGLLHLLRNPWPALTRRQYRNMTFICAVDLLSQALVMYGQLQVGSGLYVVLYSSCTVWTAVLSRIVLKKRLQTGQWLGVGEVTLGLILSKLQLLFANSQQPSAAPRDLLGGCVFLLLGTVFHSLAAIAIEWLLKARPGEQAISPMVLAGWIGAVSSTVLLSYNVVLATLYGIQELYILPVEAAGGSWGAIALRLPALLLANAAHSGSFYFMVSSQGAVAASIMKGVQAVAVFALSATLFCSFDATQCVTVMSEGQLRFGVLKVFAMYMVVRGLLGYGLAQSSAPPPPRPPPCATRRPAPLSDVVKAQ